MWGIVIYCHHGTAMKNIPLFISCPSCCSVEVKSRFSDFTPCQCRWIYTSTTKDEWKQKCKTILICPIQLICCYKWYFFKTKHLYCNCCNYGQLHILIFGTQHSLTCTLCLKLFTTSRKKPVHGLFEGLSRWPPPSTDFKNLAWFYFHVHLIHILTPKKRIT